MTIMTQMPEVPQISVDQLTDDAVFVDIREPDEWDRGHARGAVHIPMGELPQRLGELPDVGGTLAISCRSGGRSTRAVTWLLAQGYDVANLTGGMQAWLGAGKAMESATGRAPEVP